MRRRYLWAIRTAVVLVAFSSCIGSAFGLDEGAEQKKMANGSRLSLLARQAISEQPATADAAIKALRQAGPSGMHALAAAFPETEAKNTSDASWQRISHAFEKVGMQRDNWVSKLYWYTDLAAAKAEAQKQNKPILSLRLLGKLDEEFSCANSRFFRTALYPNAAVRSYLSDAYILHWESVRPAPKVTIDFGDGRKIETTITGNSIHYVLDPQGRVIDALPGLNSATAFSSWLLATHSAAEESSALEGAPRSAYLKEFHQRAIEGITRSWQEDVGRAKLAGNTSVPAVGAQIIARAVQRPLNNAPQQAAPRTVTAVQPLAVPVAGPDEVLIRISPTARAVMPLAVSKAIVETRPLRQITVAVPRDRQALQNKTDDALWQKIAELHLGESALDAASLQVLRSKASKPDAVAASFVKSIAEDTVRNEYGRHALIHEWLMADPNAELGALNKKVYTEMFFTPDSDPWLGLLPTDAYTGLTNDGVTRGS